MKSKYTPIITEEAGWWVGHIEEIPSISCRAKSRVELVRLLASALVEAGVKREETKSMVFESLRASLRNDREKLLKASEAWRRGEGR
jgi:predicted RNase H-like HicB family nuclease